MAGCSALREIAPPTAPNGPAGLGVPGLNSIHFYGAAPGTFNLNSYLTIPNAAAFNPSGGSMTIEAWVRRNSISACETVVDNNWTVPA